MNNTGVIYVHQNKINGKCYVGQTIKNPPSSRWQNGNGYSTQTKFYNAIQKYGWDNFNHIILEEVPVEQLTERENYWIQFYNSIDQGYNVAPAIANGTTGPEFGQKISDSWTAERREQQSERLKRKWQEDNDFKEKALLALKNAQRPDMSGRNNPMYGTHRTGKDAARRRAVQCIETGDCFNTVKEAAEWLGSMAQKSHISEVCKGKRKYCGKHPITKEPLHWRYIDL